MKKLFALLVLVLAFGGCGDKIANTYIVERKPMVMIDIVLTDQVAVDTWIYADSALLAFIQFRPRCPFPGFDYVSRDTIFAPEGSHLQARFYYGPPIKIHVSDTTAIKGMIWIVHGRDFVQ